MEKTRCCDGVKGEIVLMTEDRPKSTEYPLKPARDKKPLKDAVAPILGILIIIAFAAFIVFLLVNLSLSEYEWARALYLFGGVEAVAFAAAGYFFGTQIQRGKVEEAKKEAQTAEQVAAASAESAKSERRASRILAQGVLEEQQGGLMGEEQGVSSTLLAQARALLED
jgi:hypothetical protein